MSAELKFVDTNVLVYLFDGDSPDKQARARELLSEEGAMESTSVRRRRPPHGEAGETPALPDSQRAFGSGYAGLGSPA